MAEKTEKKQVNKNLIKFVSLVALIAVLAAIFTLMGITGGINPETLRLKISSYGLIAPIIFILFFMIAPALMLPSLPITVTGGILFGPLWGVVYVSIGATLGATIAFFIGRYMARDFIMDRLKDSEKLKKLNDEVDKKGWKIVAITRLIPIFPFNILNYAYGVTSIKPFDYFWASFLFMLPKITAYVVFSSSLLDILKGNISIEFVAGLILLIVVSLIPLLKRKFSQ